MATASETTPISLQRGLYTAVSPAIAPKGALTKATNITYRPGDVAPEPARGRRMAGAGGHGATRLASMAWDQDYAAGDPRRSEILYQSGTAVKTLEGFASPQTPNLSPSAARSLGTPSFLGDDDFQVLAFKRDQYLLSGGEIGWIRRTGTSQELVRAGLPQQNIIAVPSGVAGAGASWPDAIYFFGFSWFDSVRELQSSITKGAMFDYSTPVAERGLAPTGAGSPQPTLFPYVHIGPSDSIIRLYVHKTSFDTAVHALPAGVNKIRCYVGSSSTANPSPWPNMHRLQHPTDPSGNPDYSDVLISDVQAQVAIPLLGPPTHSYNSFGELYYVIPININGNSFSDAAAFFETARVTLDGKSNAVARAGILPHSRTGAVWNGCLVLDDVTAPQRYWWSFPDDPHSVPETFFGNIETDDTDELMAIRVCRDRCAFLTRSAFLRLNYLPTTTDLNFREGKLLQGVSTNGLVSRRGVAKCSPGGEAEALVWVSRLGLYMTETVYECKPWTTHIDWPALVGNVTGLSSAILLDDPERMRLVMYWNPQGGIPDRALYIHYSPTQISEEGLPSITGPIMRPAGVKSATLALLADGSRRILTIAADGTLAYEDLGYLEELGTAPGPLDWEMQTAKLYLAGKGARWRAQRMLLHATNDGDAVADFHMEIALGESGPPVVDEGGISDKHVPVGDELLIYDGWGPTEYATLRLSGECANVRFNELGVTWDGMLQANRRDA